MMHFISITILFCLISFSAAAQQTYDYGSNPKLSPEMTKELIESKKDPTRQLTDPKLLEEFEVIKKRINKINFVMKEITRLAKEKKVSALDSNPDGLCKTCFVKVLGKPLASQEISKRSKPDEIYYLIVLPYPNTYLGYIFHPKTNDFVSMGLISPNK